MLRKTISIILGIILVAGVVTFGVIFRIHEIEIEYVGGAPTEVDPNLVYQQCAVNTDGSILGLNETAVKRRIAEIYPDRLVVVKDIVREFPHTVKIYVEEHAPICAVPIKTGDGYALADRDFALDRRVGEQDVDKNALIIIKGVTVGNTYDTADFATLRSTFIALEAKGIPTAALPKMFASISFESENLIFETRDGAKLKTSRVSPRAAAQGIAVAYDEYIATLQ